MTDPYVRAMVVDETGQLAVQIVGVIVEAPEGNKRTSAVIDVLNIFDEVALADLERESEG